MRSQLLKWFIVIIFAVQSSIQATPLNPISIAISHSLPSKISNQYAQINDHHKEVYPTQKSNQRKQRDHENLLTLAA